jgi:hypothetical protein
MPKESVTLKFIGIPKSNSQSIVMQTDAQFAILSMEGSGDVRKYTMFIAEAEDPGTSGNTTHRYFVSVKSATLPQSNFLEGLLTLVG